MLRSLPILFALAAAAAPAAPRPNFVLAMADDQGWGDIGYNGHPVLRTPNLDEMAATGLRFDRFYAAAPTCSPTRGSVLTGRHPNRFGCFTAGYDLRPREITIAEALKTAGYATGHFGKWHLGSVRADSPVCPGASGFDVWMSSPNYFDNDPLMSREGRVIETRGESSRVIVDAALEFIRAAVEREQPFLAVVWFGSPHAPHVTTDELRKLYEGEPKRMQSFYGEITGVDRAIGHLRRGLRELGVADDTLLWYTSDNGSMPIGSRGGLSGRKGTLGEGGIRVPAVLEWPAHVTKPRAIGAPAGTVDIYPTLLDVAGVEVRGQLALDGISLAPWIAGGPALREKPLGFWVYPARVIPTRGEEILQAMAGRKSKKVAGAEPVEPGAGEITRRYPEDELPGDSAWIDGDYKLRREVSRSGDAHYALFDIARDPQENNDLGDAQPARRDRMKAQLEAWQRSVVRSLNAEDCPEQSP